MKVYLIIITPEAERDINNIGSYVALNDLPGKATDLCDALERKCDSLSYVPQRGRCVPEFKNIDVFDIFEIFYKPYRIVYKILNTSVVIYGVFDGRRDLKEVLPHRVLGRTVFEYH
ncbi:MAG TPA: type II toxin-antitoxin system RelE/ParE family toxin [Gammaproteobacteria bacterium]|nr:type II toxin-antitoxin system RelE/ParE family toxin [Gammaproteobacteria bacterium]